jgi:hypothetical protein
LKRKEEKKKEKRMEKRIGDLKRERTHTSFFLHQEKRKRTTGFLDLFSFRSRALSSHLILFLERGLR